MSDMPNKIAAWRFAPSKADEWLHGGWSEDHDRKTTSYILESSVAEQIKAAVMAERETCAAVAESMMLYSADDIANAIRLRSEIPD